MSESTVCIEHIGELAYHTSLTKDKVEFVSSIEFRNAGKTIFGEETWWQGISFDEPGSIDELIAALAYARADMGGISDDYECISTALHKCENECSAKRVDDGWECKWCGEVTTSKYDEKPKRCSGCGAFFNEYEEGDAS